MTLGEPNNFLLLRDEGRYNEIIRDREIEKQEKEEKELDEELKKAMIRRETGHFVSVDPMKDWSTGFLKKIDGKIQDGWDGKKD